MERQKSNRFAAIILLGMFLLNLVFLASCAEKEDIAGDAVTFEPVDTGETISVSEASTDATETSEAETEALIDYSVESRVDGLHGSEREAALIELIKDRSEAVKAANLGDWYQLETECITLKTEENTVEITYAETIASITALLAADRLEACVSIPELSKAMDDEGGISSDYERVLNNHSNYLTSPDAILDFHNGVYIGVLTHGILEMGYEVTEVQIGTGVDGMQLQFNTSAELPFLYVNNSFAASPEIVRLLVDLLQ